jgi:hypothetical protein
MAGLPEVIGLLYRADWTRLSLSAEVRFEQDGDLARRREGAVNGSRLVAMVAALSRTKRCRSGSAYGTGRTTARSPRSR